MIVSFPDDAALMVCFSIERLIFALRPCESRDLEPSPTKPFPPNGQAKEKKTGSVCMRTFFSEAIFMASAFLGATYRFPFFVVEEEACRVAFCFEVCRPFTFP